MVQFTIGDQVTLCASIKDFCGQTEQYYLVKDINIAKGQCTINTATSSCLSFSNVELEFQWTNDLITPETTCSSSSTLRVLGSGFTDSNGVVSITHTIDNIDFYNFNTNTYFDLRVCIKNKTPAEAPNPGSIRSALGHTDGITLACSPQCFGADLYNTDWNTVTESCVKGTLLEANSPQCTSRKFALDYDISFLPADFLNLVQSNISTISSSLGTILPKITGLLQNGVSYVESTYSNGIFTIHVTYNSLSTVAFEIPEPIKYLGSIAAGVVVGLLCMAVLSATGIGVGWAIVAGIVTAIVVSFTVRDETSGESSTGTSNVTPLQRAQIISEFVATSKLECATRYPDCSTIPLGAGCDPVTMRLYNECLGILDIMGSKATGELSTPGSTDPGNYVEIQACHKAVDDKLAAGTITPAEAKTEIDKCSAQADTNIQNNVNTLQPQPEPCWFPVPFTDTCLITESQKNTAVTIGLLAVGGYIAYKFLTRK